MDRFRGYSATATLVVFLGVIPSAGLHAQSEFFLGGGSPSFSLQHQQQWGVLGRDVAAAASGKGLPLRIGERTYERGLGHHANGEIGIDLRDAFLEFRCGVGVQWQGGQKGSVRFQVSVDGRTAFECGPMSDSDAAREVRVPLANARRLTLIATDGGDGIGCDMANWVDARLVRDPDVPNFGEISATLAGQPAPPASDRSCGFSLIAGAAGPQIAVMSPASSLVVGVREDEEARLAIPALHLAAPVRVTAEVALTDGEQADVAMGVNGDGPTTRITRGEVKQLSTQIPLAPGAASIVLKVRGAGGEAGVRWRKLQGHVSSRTFDIRLSVPSEPEQFPPRELPNLRASIEQQLIEWDWRMQDGIGTDRESRTWSEAIAETLRRGDALVDLLTQHGWRSEAISAWDACRRDWNQLASASGVDESSWESLWRRTHLTRRRIVLENPVADFGPLLFAKHVPSNFSHQLTQYSSLSARPGGGIFALDAPGRSMSARRLDHLPSGSFLYPEISWDGRRVMFAYCELDSAPADRESQGEQNYHLYEMAADGTGLRQLTQGRFDDFAPRYLPDGKILFLSTRRGGFHRCGRGPCPVHALAIAQADGSDPRVISFHETHEWDPAVLNDGHIIYTRWDYVDRNAVYYQQLWTARADGTSVRSFYGNNTFNPVGIWEARPVPNSHRIIATAAAHHAMTAGSIVLLDVTRGEDGLEPLTRLTPDVLFPESEYPIQNWHAPAGAPVPPPVPPEERRWPGHSYRTPYPLSEDFFLAAYSFDPLVGEPLANRANQFGLYLVDRFGNKELLYRDVNIGSQWPMPLRARPRPPVLAPRSATLAASEGTFFVQNVNKSWYPFPAGQEITRLRIIQVLLKTTPHANTPRVGLANASPGKQVLGTVPVEPDGSAYFRAPAGTPILFQALDKQGRAVQTMRSVTYLQPGEQASCVGCHEHSTRAPDVHIPALAALRPPSDIAPGPDGSKPLSYPLLVQPVLDSQCVRCHQGAEPAGGIDLTGKPVGEFSASYQALAPLVSFSQWNGAPSANAEPKTLPDTFGARASKLTKLLLEKHQGVSLTDQDWERLNTWMDANALFYGTFDPDDQQRQRRGERIAGPPFP